MNIKDWPCWAKIGVAVGLAIFVLNWPSTSSEWAAWIQAIGSVLALVGVYWATQKQAQIAITQIHEEAKIEKKNKLEKATVIVEVICDLVQKMQVEFKSGEVESFSEAGELRIQIMLELFTDRHLLNPLADSLRLMESTLDGPKEAMVELVRLGLCLKQLDVYIGDTLSGPWGNEGLRSMLDKSPEEQRLERVNFGQKMLNKNLVDYLKLTQATCESCRKRLVEYRRSLS